MQVEILGSGGATAIPRPGCECRVCVEARERGVPYSRTGAEPLRARPERPLRHAGGVAAPARPLRRDGDRRLLLLALASGSHDGTPRLGGRRRSELPGLAARSGSGEPDGHLPAGAGRDRFRRASRDSRPLRLPRGARLRPDPRAHGRRDREPRRCRGQAVPPARELRLRLRAQRRRQAAPRRDGRAARLGAAARGPRRRSCDPPDGAVRGRSLHRRAKDPSAASGAALRGDVRADARDRRPAPGEAGRAQPRGGGVRARARRPDAARSGRRTQHHVRLRHHGRSPSDEPGRS